MKDKNIAGILALFLGGFGVHRFYLGQTGMGFFYLIFCWFPLIWIIALIDAIVFFSMNPDNFNIKYNKSYFQTAPRSQPQEAGERRYYYDRNMRRQEERRANAPSRSATTPQPVRNNEAEKASGVRKFKDYDYEGAIADFEKALKIDPRDVAVHFNLACTYSLTEQTEKALFHLDKAVDYGFNDFKRIKEHDALAYLRVQPEFEAFEKNGFRLVRQLEPEPDVPLDLKSEDLLEQLQRLGDLREKGLLTETEFAAQKKKLLG